jgi:hypothetical protein
VGTLRKVGAHIKPIALSLAATKYAPAFPIKAVDISGLAQEIEFDGIFTGSCLFGNTRMPQRHDAQVILRIPSNNTRVARQSSSL